jgi:hypothetical protein
VSRRIRSFILCLATGAILPLAIPGVASAQATPKAAPAASTSATPHSVGGCHQSQTSVMDL